MLVFTAAFVVAGENCEFYVNFYAFSQRKKNVALGSESDRFCLSGLGF